MSDETFTIGEEEFDGHQLYGPTHGEDLSLEAGSGSGTIPYKVRFADIDRLSDAMFPIAALIGDRYEFSAAFEHPYRSGLVAKRMRVAPYSPARELADGAYEWAIATVEFAPAEAADAPDAPEFTGELAGYKERWSGGVTTQESMILGLSSTPETAKRKYPYTTINLSITRPPLPRQPISNASLYFNHINSAVFTTPSGVQIAAGELRYASISADVSVVRVRGAVIAAWHVTDEFLWRPKPNWKQDYNGRNLDIVLSKTLDATLPPCEESDLMGVFKA